LTEGCSEKYGKKLIGKNDMEDGLKRLDKLTQEEARMAVAQNLKATHTVDERVRGVANTMVDIDNKVAVVDDRIADVDDRVADVDDRVADVNDRVARVDDRVADVNDRVARVDDRVAGVDDRVASVGDKVTEVINGAQIIFSQS
jgi:methyl-accepting chemotaxis protein